jgi:hypothetical protein
MIEAREYVRLAERDRQGGPSNCSVRLFFFCRGGFF